MRARVLLSGAIAFTLSACGGGGKKVASAPPPPVSAPPALPPAPPKQEAEQPPVQITPASQQPRRSPADDEEYRANYFAAEAIGALYALDHGHTGRGVLVGVMDNGVAETSELAGKISPLSRDFGSIHREDGSQLERNSTGDGSSDHGTPVAAIIAARNNGVGVQGLAPDARIVSLRVDYVQPDGSTALGEGMAAALRYAADQRIPVVNRSIGRSDAGEAATDFAAAAEYFSASGGLLVQSTGNSGGAEPAELAEVTAMNRAAWLFVSAVMPHGDGVIAAPYANRCGSMQDRCVVAVGENVTQGVDGTLLTLTGTSSAAPQASALAAMILSKWPHLSGRDAGQIILNTARDLGAAGVDTVYGAGLIDARAALSPVQPKLSNGKVASALAGSRMLVGSAFGAGAMRELMEGVVVVDAFERDFPVDLSGLITHQPTLHLPMVSMLGASNDQTFALQGAEVRFATQRHTLAGNRAQLTSAAASIQLTGGATAHAWWTAAEAQHPYLQSATLHSGVTVPLAVGQISVMGHTGSQDDRRIGGVTAEWRTGAADLRFGFVDERGAVFGTPVGTGSLRFGDGARTAFVEATARTELNGWSLQAEGGLGLTRLLLAGDTMLQGSDLLTSGHLSIFAARPVADGQLAIGVEQPLIVLSGRAHLRLPVGFDATSRTPLFENRSAPLHGRPDPRLSLSFARNGAFGSLSLHGALQPQSGAVQASVTWSQPLRSLD